MSVLPATPKRPLPLPVPTTGRLPIWQPDKARGLYQLACPLCDDTHVRVHSAVVEVGGLEFGSSAGRVVLACNGHADSTCKHRFSIIISFHDAGVQCVVDAHVMPLVTIKP